MSLDRRDYQTAIPQLEKRIKELETKGTDVGLDNYKGLANVIYPVGSIYMSVNNTNPELLFGGTWEAWGKGCVPVGVDVDQEEFEAVEKFGGEKTHKLEATEIPAHTHNSRSLVGGARLMGWAGSSTNAATSGIITTTSNNAKDRTASSGSNMGAQTIQVNATHTHDSVGGNGAHNNLQPYITCYMWKRTA